MKLYILLILSHFIGDVLLQRNVILSKILKGKDLSKLKRQSKGYLALHAIIYSVPVTAVLVYAQLLTIHNFLIVLVSHFVIDYVKCYKILYEDASSKFFVVNLIDQLLHISVLLIITNSI